MDTDRSRVVRVVAWALAFIAPAAALAAWFTPRPDLDRSDAIEVALGSLSDVGADGEVTEDVDAAVHRTEEGQDVDVWIVPVDVDGERIELRVQRSVGQLVYVDDRIGPDDTGRLLTDDQFVRMGKYRNDVTGARGTTRNIAATVAATLISATAWVLAGRSDRLTTST